MKKIIAIVMIAIFTINAQLLFAQSAPTCGVYIFGAFACPAGASATVQADLNYTVYANTFSYSPLNNFLYYRIVGVMPNATSTTQSTNSYFGTQFQSNKFTFTVNRGNNVGGTPYIMIQSSANGSSNWTTIKTVYSTNTIQTGLYSNLVASDFSINNVSSPQGTLPGTILRCNSTALELKLSNFAYLNATNCTYTIEKGVYSGTTFVPLGGTANTFTQPLIAGLPASTNLLIAPFTSLRLSDWNGYVRLTFSANGPCNTLTNISKIYNLDGNIEFTQRKNITCGNTAVFNRYTDINFTNNTNGVFSAPPCKEGWMGAKSCGITLSSTLTGITSSTISVDRLNPTTFALDQANVVKVITPNGLPPEVFFNKPSDFDPVLNGLPTGYANLSVQPDNWFQTNFQSIKNSALFRINVTAVSNGTPCKSIGYFKIGAGNVATLGSTWKKDNELQWDGIEVDEELTSIYNLYPNPVKNIITIDSKLALSINSKFQIFDLFGNKVMENQLINASNNINVSTLKAGVYIVKLSNRSKIEIIRFIKE